MNISSSPRPWEEIVPAIGIDSMGSFKLVPIQDDIKQWDAANSSHQLQGVSFMSFLCSFCSFNTKWYAYVKLKRQVCIYAGMYVYIYIWIYRCILDYTDLLNVSVRSLFDEQIVVIHTQPYSEAMVRSIGISPKCKPLPVIPKKHIPWDPSTFLGSV